MEKCRKSTNSISSDKIFNLSLKRCILDTKIRKTKLDRKQDWQLVQAVYTHHRNNKNEYYIK